MPPLLSTRLHALRTERGWSLRQLARVSAIPYQTVHRLERTPTANPTLRVVQALAAALNVRLEYLLGESNSR